MVLHCLFSWPFHEMRTITVTSVLQVWSQAYPSWFIQWQNWNSGHLLSSFLTPNTPTSNHPLWSSHYVAFQTAEPKQCACIRPGSKKQILKNGTLSQFFWKAEREKQRGRQGEFPIHWFTLQISATTKWWARLRPSARNSIWVSPKRLVGIQLLESSALSPCVFISKKLDLGVDHGLKIQAFWYRM